MSHTFFSHVITAQPDPTFKLKKLFDADKRLEKVDLSIGLYKNDRLVTPIMNSVKIAEAFLLEVEKTKEYLPIEGDTRFIEKIGKLTFGEAVWHSEKNRICGIQTVGATGALKVGGEFFKKEVGKFVTLSAPTWINHHNIFVGCEMHVSSYPYYDLSRRGLEFEKSYQFFERLPEGVIVIFQSCCHNPTGFSWKLEEWKQIQLLFQAKRLIPFFDFAYQGFGRGLNDDAEVIRLWAKTGMEMAVASSQAKNFGLYSERPGVLFILTTSEKIAKAVLSKVKVISRGLYSTPPSHGAAIVSHILSTPLLQQQWEEELNGMRDRTKRLRYQFIEQLTTQNKADFSFLQGGEGMFLLTGLKTSQVEKLRSQFAIYMTDDGRINIAGFSDANIPYVVESFFKVMIG